MRVGAKAPIRVPECGIDGLADVLEIRPCPTIEPGAGRVVTGLFRHRGDATVDVHVRGEPAPIGCTGNHPFWSADRESFVRADDLREGESVETLAGLATVAAVLPRSDHEPVFNLEIDGEHVYRVGLSGVLVHNGKACPKGVTRNANNGVDFGDSLDLYPATHGQRNTVQIQYTGSRRRDFAAANRAAEIGTTQKPPRGYTWHHLDDYDPVTNTGTMQLVKQSTHKATYPHVGGVAQYEAATGVSYDLPDWALDRVPVGLMPVPDE